MFNNLQDKLDSAFKNLKGQGRITELNVATTVKEIRRALVDADVNYKIAKEFTDKIKDKGVEIHESGCSVRSLTKARCWKKSC